MPRLDIYKTYFLLFDINDNDTGRIAGVGKEVERIGGRVFREARINNSCLCRGTSERESAYASNARVINNSRDTKIITKLHAGRA